MPDQSALNAVVFDHVSFAFDEHPVLRDVSFTVPRGSMRIVLGASGAGKSVLLKLILALLRLRADMGMSFQEIALFDSLTVAENVGYRLYEESDLPLDRARERVEEVLGFIGLADYIDSMPSELSGGQRRRVAIARAMASRPSLLLFDDPTTGLDPIIA